MRRVFAGLLALTLLAVACTHADSTARPAAPPQTQPQTQPTPPTASGSDAQAVAGFQQRLSDYAALHARLEKTLPALPKETTPTVIDKHQRALSALLQEHRKTAKRGDIFDAATERLMRRLLNQVFSGAEGAKLKATVMDENPTTVSLSVNARYPDEIPLSTMPPQVLAILPKLPDDLEYRFIGPRLVLVDVHAHTIADYIENALPQ